MRLAKIVAALSLLFAGTAYAGWGIFQDSVSGGGVSGQLFPLAIGPGGQITRVEVQCDAGWKQCNGNNTVTRVGRYDAFGTWGFTAGTACGNAAGGIAGSTLAGCWGQLMTSASMPPGDNGAAGGGTGQQGGYEITISPVNTTNMAMIPGNGCLYISQSNAGGHPNWVKQTNFTCVTVNPNSGGLGEKFFGPFMQWSPTNGNVLYVGTPAAGTFQSTNALAGGSSSIWTKITGLGTGGADRDPNGAGGGTIIKFDPSDATGNTFYACTYGTGVFKVTSANTTPSVSALNTTGMPTTCMSIDVDNAGVVYLLDNTHDSVTGGGTATNINYYSGSAWTHSTLATNQFLWYSVAADTNSCTNGVESGCHITILDQGGSVAITLTGTGGLASAALNTNNSTVANDVPWLATTGNNLSPSISTYDPSQSNVMLIASGVGAWEMQPPSNNTNAYVYYSLSAGLQLLATLSAQMAVVGGQPFFTFFDRAAFTIPPSAPTTFPSAYFGTGITPGWSVSVPAAASSKAFVFSDAAPSSEQSSSTANTGGSYTPCPTMPAELQTVGGNSNTVGGNFIASSSSHLIAVLGNNQDIYHSEDGCTSWTISQIGSVPQGGILTTNGTTATSSAVLHFASVPSNIQSEINAGTYTFIVNDITNPAAVVNAAVSSATSTSITLTANVTSPGVSSGDVISLYIATGWNNHVTNYRGPVCADLTTTDTYYAYNTGPTGHTGVAGIWKTTDNGVNWLQKLSSNLFNEGGNPFDSIRLQCEPTESGVMWFVAAYQGQAPQICTDTGTISCSVVSAFTAVEAIGFGKAANGSSHPAVYIRGTQSGTDTIWRSNDDGVTWANILAAHPDISLDYVVSIVGDMNTYGRIYVCYGSTTCKYGDFP